MPAEKTSKDRNLWQGIAMGAVSCAAAVFLLLPTAVVIEKNVIGPEYQEYLSILCLFITAFVCTVVIGKRGDWITVVSSALTVLLVLLLLEASMNNIRLSVTSVLPAVLAESIGVSLGSLAKKEKRAVHKRKQKKQYYK